MAQNKKNVYDQISPVDVFRPAVRAKMRMTVGIAGASGAGKTVAMLRMAAGLADGDWSKVFVIDTDDSGALAYVGNPDFGIGQFQHMNLRAPFDPRRFALAGRLADQAGAQVIVIDSLSLAWAGPGGFRDLHEQAGGTWGDYQKVDPIWYELMDFIVHESSAHIICGIRSKMKHEPIGYTNERGENKIKVDALGLGPIIRPDTEYNFRLWLDVVRESHLAHVFTARGDMPMPDGQFEVNQQLGANLLSWANAGDPTVNPSADLLSSQQETVKAAEAIGKSNGSSNGSGGGQGMDLLPEATPDCTYNDFWELVRNLYTDRNTASSVGQKALREGAAAGLNLAQVRDRVKDQVLNESQALAARYQAGEDTPA